MLAIAKFAFALSAATTAHAGPDCRSAVATAVERRGEDAPQTVHVRKVNETSYDVEFIRRDGPRPGGFRTTVTVDPQTCVALKFDDI